MKRSYLYNKYFLNFRELGSGCGSVGGAVASNARGPRFEYSHRQTFIYRTCICLLSTISENRKMKKKWPGMAKYLQKSFGDQIQHSGSTCRPLSSSLSNVVVVVVVFAFFAFGLRLKFCQRRNSGMKNKRYATSGHGNRYHGELFYSNFLLSRKL